MKKITADTLTLYTKSLLDFFFPRYCICCRERLAVHEEIFCITCRLNLPRIRHASFEDNEITRIFWGLVPIRKGTAFWHYTKTSPYARILFDLKYHNRPETGLITGRMFAEELAPTGFFDGIDLIVPIPLSRRKERKRGYNQSAWIAQGISEVTGIPVDTTSILRSISNPSQTTLDEQLRRENVRNIFTVRHPENLAGRHILLIDDVITTGATMLSCAETITHACQTEISVLSLAWAGHS